MLKIVCIFPFIFRNVAKKLNVAPTDMVSAWFESTSPTLLTNYSLCNSPNVDELGLFYQAFSGKIFQLKRKKCSGEKPSENLLNWLAVANLCSGKFPRISF